MERPSEKDLRERVFTALEPLGFVPSPLKEERKNGGNYWLRTAGGRIVLSVPTMSVPGGLMTTASVDVRLDELETLKNRCNPNPKIFAQYNDITYSVGANYGDLLGQQGAYTWVVNSAEDVPEAANDIAHVMAETLLPWARPFTDPSTVFDFLVNHRDKATDLLRRIDIAKNTVGLALLLGHPATMVEDLVVRVLAWLQENRDGNISEFLQFTRCLGTFAHDPAWPYARITPP